jgi:predicted pyridoxine 5'-phosphate oxidase superfamily flavin-nucleotide-binding protein
MNDDGPFHAGELAMQTRTGVRERLQASGGRFIRDHMPDQHRELFTKLPTLFVGGLDGQRRPWASMLFGPPGFVQSPDARHLVVGALPLHGDPLRGVLAADVPVGLLGIEPQTRRRNRMNGTVVAVTASGFTVGVDQSFGNCPQYIQARLPRRVERAGAPTEAREAGPRLDAPSIALVRNADTFFIATASRDARARGGADGADVSHRGGKPGFVRVEDDGDATVLTVPDFRGNFLFNTLGNIAIHPRAGLLFVDYESGDLLQITGRAEIVFDAEQVRLYAGAQRLLRVTVEASRWYEAAVPLRWSEPQYAPQLAALGEWPR